MLLQIEIVLSDDKIIFFVHHALEMYLNKIIIDAENNKEKSYVFSINTFMDIVCLFLPTGVVSKLDAKIYFN
jgi:hypothetical protein